MKKCKAKNEDSSVDIFAYFLKKSLVKIVIVLHLGYLMYRIR